MTFQLFADLSLLLGALVGVVLLMSSLGGPLETHFPLLARRALSGNLDLAQVFVTDTAPYAGKIYFPGGLLPVIFHMPLLFLDDDSAQMALRIFLNGMLVWTLYKIARREPHTGKITAGILALSFLAATAYGFVAFSTFSTYLIQVIAVLLVALALLEYTGRRRWWLIGTLLGGLICTRPHVALVGCFFLGEAWLTAENKRQRMSRFLQLGLPMLIGTALQGIYNVLRFDSFLEFGYQFQIISRVFQADVLEYGRFSLHYLPSNLFYLLFKGPVWTYSAEGLFARIPLLIASPWGMSIFLTSPFLLFGLWAKTPQRKRWLIWGSALLVLAFPLTYFGSGYYQYGFRYAVEIYPLLYLLTVEQIGGKLTRWHRLSIFFGLLMCLFVGAPLFIS